MSVHHVALMSSQREICNGGGRLIKLCLFRCKVRPFRRVEYYKTSARERCAFEQIAHVCVSVRVPLAVVRVCGEGRAHDSDNAVAAAAPGSAHIRFTVENDMRVFCTFGAIAGGPGGGGAAPSTHVELGGGGGGISQTRLDNDATRSF